MPVDTGEVLNYFLWDDPVMRSTGGEMLVGPVSIQNRNTSPSKINAETEV
jgi:hypothetical protein